MYFFYFYPMGVELERRRPPLLTGLLLGIMTAVFVWSRYFPLLLPLHPYRLIFYPGNQAAWTVVTAIFVHAGWFHFLSNMVYLLVFAPSLEDRHEPLHADARRGAGPDRRAEHAKRRSIA